MLLCEEHLYDDYDDESKNLRACLRILKKTRVY